jgi:hypothetical protein
MKNRYEHQLDCATMLGTGDPFPVGTSSSERPANRFAPFKACLDKEQCRSAGADTLVPQVLLPRSMISLCIPKKVPRFRSEEKLEDDRFHTSLSLSLACRRSHWWVSRRSRR